MSRLHRYDRAYRYVRNIAQPHCESYTQFCLRTDVLIEAINKAKKYDDKETAIKIKIKNGIYQCPKCDYLFKDDANYCPYCGQKIDCKN